MKRDAYWDRHYANATEKKLIDNLVPLPALFSAYLLWEKYFNFKKYELPKWVVERYEKTK
jgi:hypothetical protein